MNKILRSVGLADYHYNLIEENDIVAVGVSGGKDSCLLLLALDEYRKKSFKHFNVIGIHLEMGFPGMDFTTLNQYFADRDIELIHVPTKIYAVLQKEAKEDGSLKCSLCSKFKKALVIKEAKKHGCTKVAFAHHAEDAVETLFMNMIHGAKIATFTPKMYLTQSEVTFIRPLVYVHEDAIRNEVKMQRIPFVTSTCPMDGHTQRQELKGLIEQLYTQFPNAKKNLLTSLSNTDKMALWVKENGKTGEETDE
ncbi:MAG: tRNA 2-thiocytidine biosynthesis TtcA family protein [Erysipelotrichaceae bacterium]